MFIIKRSIIYVPSHNKRIVQVMVSYRYGLFGTLKSSRQMMLYYFFISIQSYLILGYASVLHTHTLEVLKSHIIIRENELIHLRYSFTYRLNIPSTARNVFAACNFGTHIKQIVEIPIVCKSKLRKHFITIIGYLYKQKFHRVI